MSKYNHSHSIPIDSLTKEELKEAIKEWSEGDDAMEQLLWACYHHKVETTDCHVGARPYIGFHYNGDLENYSRLLYAAQQFSSFTILFIPDGGNPFSGPNWYEPSLLIGSDVLYQEEADTFFDLLKNSLNEESVKEHPLLRLFRFFIDKESSLLFRFKNNETNEYIFSIEARPIIEERYQTYHEIFMNAGFSEVDRETSDNRHEWIIKSNDLDSLMNQIHSSFSIIMESFPLNIETTEDQILNFNALARFKMRELSKEEFDKWLKKKKEEMN